MTKTPERIWASCETPDAKMKSGRWHESPYGTEYISRAVHDAAVSAARKEGVREAAQIADRHYANGDMGNPGHHIMAAAETSP